MELNRKETALALDIDPTTLDHWADRGCPGQRAGKGLPARYVLGEVVRWWIDREVEKALEQVQSADDHDLDALRARKLAAEAGLKELQLRRANADLIPADEFDAALKSMLTAAQVQACEVLPVRAARRLVGETDERRLREALRDEARQACAEIADADPEQIFAGVVARMQEQEVTA
jgi:phage terminase Nu1 subunit (DNA packaging protein)